MTSKPDLGLWLGVASGVAVIAAIVAGLVSVGGPGEARAYRLDEAKLAAMQDIVAAAQCAYTYTDRIPATREQIRVDLRDPGKRIISCANIVAPNDDATISYAPEGQDRINICADFLRPSRPDDQQPAYFNPRFRAPAFSEPRTAAGRHCFSVRLVKLTDEDVNGVSVLTSP